MNVKVAVFTSSQQLNIVKIVSLLPITPGPIRCTFSNLVLPLDSTGRIHILDDDPLCIMHKNVFALWWQILPLFCFEVVAQGGYVCCFYFIFGATI